MLIKVSGSVQVTSTTVPGSTGNCVVVSNLLPHSVGSPVQGATGLKRAIEMDNRGEVSQPLIGTIFFDTEKSYLYVILRTISSFFPHQKYCSYQKLYHSKLATPPQTPQTCDSSPRLSISILHSIFTSLDRIQYNCIILIRL